jgi:hypothetical protein
MSSEHAHVSRKEFLKIFCATLKYFEQIIFHIDNFCDVEKYSFDMEWNIHPHHPTTLMETIIILSFSTCFLTKIIVALRWCIQVNYNYYTFTSTIHILLE